MSFPLFEKVTYTQIVQSQTTQTSHITKAHITTKRFRSSYIPCSNSWNFKSWIIYQETKVALNPWIVRREISAKFHVQQFKGRNDGLLDSLITFWQHFNIFRHCFGSKQFTILRGFLYEGNKQILHHLLQSCFRGAIDFLWMFSDMSSPVA